MTLVGNITDINDKIYDAARAAGRAVGRAGARDDAPHYIADTERLGLGRPDDEPLASEYVEPIVELIGALVERGHAYAAGGDVYFRVRTLRRLRRAVAPRRRPDGPGRGRRGRRPQGGSARLRALEGAQGGRGHLLGLAVGPRAGRAGTSSARRWPRRCWASSSTSTAAASTSSSRTTRTRPRRRWPRAASRWRGCGCTTGCSSSSGEKMAKSVGNIRGLAEVLDDVGGEALRAVLQRRPLPAAARVLATSAGGRAARRASGSAKPAGGWSPGASPEELARATATRSSTRCATTSTPPRRWPRCTSWIREANRCRGPVGDAHLREMLDVLGLESLLAAEEGPPAEAVELAERRDAARAATGLGRGRPPARRAARAGLGGPRRPGGTGAGPGVMSAAAAARRSATIAPGRSATIVPARAARRRSAPGRRPRAPHGHLRPQRGPRGAARPAEGPSDLGDRGGGRRGVGGRDGGGRRRPTRSSERVRLGRPPGRLRARSTRTRTPTPPSCSPRRDPLLVALDEVTDPQNLGAVARTAEAAGATGDRDPRAPLGRGHAGGLQGVGRARSSTCRSPACATSPTSSPTPRRPAAWCYGAAAGARTPYDEPDYTGGVVAGARRRGQGPAAAGRRRCATTSSRCRCAGASNRST